MEKAGVLISGALGHMGRVLADTLKEQDWGLKLAAGVDKAAGEYPAPLFSSVEEVNVPFDVAVDFSVPEAAMAALQLCLKEKKPIVIATTGLTEEQKELVGQAAKVIPVFYTRNMSLGVNLQLALVREAARVLGPGFDAEIVETHHRLKYDSPSGTALMLAEAVKEEKGEEYTFAFGRHEAHKRREQREIGIHSLRGGTVVGEHQVSFFGEDEELSITHRAFSKRVFAQGALRAAVFVLRQKPGLYDMASLLKA